MLKLLVPIEENETRADFLRALCKWLKRVETPVELHLIHVQPAMPREVGMFISQENMNDYQREEGMKQLEPAMAQLKEAEIPFLLHIFVGVPADIILRFAEQKGIHQIVMGHQPTHSIANLFQSSVSSKVLQAAEIPVMLIR